ncbi:MAG: methyltransferase domain-containing protein [Alphaproteobacteria bacterium]|nr:methyltransferase domain-containing protein [Alphaproteobacteria bacterium]
MAVGATTSGSPTIQPVEFCCPSCRGPVVEQAQSYECSACARRYPILFGIPDFRLRSDRYLSLEEERAKAEKLHKAAETRSFAELLAYYYEITDDVTPAAAARFASYALDGPRRAGLAMDDFADTGRHGRLLDVGCGSGGAILAGGDRFASVVGLDIALRWLVIARKRLEESSVVATLVCADLAAPPFADGQFDHVLALDVVEHAYEIEPAICAIRGQLRPGGTLWLSAANRHWLGPHPATGVWAAAFRSPRSRLVSRGPDAYDALRFVAFLSPGKLRKACGQAGLDVVDIRPSRISGKRGGGLKGLAMDGYAAVRQSRRFGPLLTALGPFFQLVARAP